MATPPHRGQRLADARRDLAVILLSFGGAVVLAGLVVSCAPLAGRVESSARGPDVLVRGGTALAGLCLAGFSWILAVRARRGWRGSALLAAVVAAAGLGSLVGLVALAARLSDGRDRFSMVAPGLVASGTALLVFGAGVLRSRRWARPALAGPAALVGATLSWAAVESLLSHQVTLFLLATLGGLPAILVLTSLCLPGGAALLSSNGVDEDLPDVPDDAPLVFFVAGARLSIGLFLLLWLSLTLLVAPNVANAMHRARQRTTMGSLRTVMTAVEAWAVDHGTYPEASSIDDLARIVEPTYVARLPRRDGWGWPLDYRSRSTAPAAGSIPTRTNAGAAPRCYVVRSPGRDGHFEHTDPFVYEGGPTNGFDRDIVYASSTRSQWPEGSMGP